MTAAAMPDRRADQRRRPSARTPCAAVHRNRVVSRPSRPTARNAVIVSAPGADRRGALHLAAQVGRQAGRGAAHPEDHRGDQADREDAEQAADRLLRPARQHADRERQHGGERAGQRHRAEHAEPYRRRRHPAASCAGQSICRCARRLAATCRCLLRPRYLHSPGAGSPATSARVRYRAPPGPSCARPPAVCSRPSPASRPSRSPISRLGTLSAHVTSTKVSLT